MGAATVRGRDRRAFTLGIIALALLLVLLLRLPTEAASARVLRSGPSAKGGVALTFDDGWGKSSCKRIASTLRSSDAVGTFFINGIHLRAEPQRWRRILRGMPVANHTRSHPFLTKLPATGIRNQIRTNGWIHKRVLGRPMLKILRPPYGAYDSQVLRVAGQLGYRHVVLWSRSAADSSSAATVTSIIRHATGGKPGDIILMHCGPRITADALPTIIRHYQRRGIKLIGLDRMFGLD